MSSSQQGFGAMAASPLQLAKIAYAERRRRDREIAGSEIFGEPAWDLLLFLFIAMQEGRIVALSTLLDAIAVPPTTAIRWLKVLETKDFVEPTRQNTDHQGSVTLSEHGNLTILQFFSERR